MFWTSNNLKSNCIRGRTDALRLVLRPEGGIGSKLRAAGWPSATPPGMSSIQARLSQLDWLSIILPTPQWKPRYRFLDTLVTNRRRERL